jgi:hypothetical protein
LGLRRKFVDMLWYFYGEKETSEGDIKRFFENMNVGRGERNEGVQ